MKVVILAAGLGNRLGNAVPKPLTQLGNGRSMMDMQVRTVSDLVGRDHVFVVVGFKKELIMELFGDLTFIYNPRFTRENTAKSLLRALRKIDDDVLWLNGDVVCTPAVVSAVLQHGKSCMAVTAGVVGEEEVKYLLDPKTGCISEVSKEVVNGLGEAVGVNLVRREDLARFRTHLEACADNDYFERGLQSAVADGLLLYAVEVDAKQCVEVDFPADLERANALITHWV
ncbi:MAG: phosphocholine cytidylyltransferase family protein [Polyangia bacterium]